MVGCIVAGSRGDGDGDGLRERRRESVLLGSSLPFAVCGFWENHAGEITKEDIIVLTHTIGKSVKSCFCKRKKIYRIWSANHTMSELGQNWVTNVS